MSPMLLMTLLAVVTVTSPIGRGDADRHCYEPPVAAAIAERFREPVCAYCAGQRGLTYLSRSGDVVRAVAAGIVTYSGLVAGTRYLVVAHDDGLVATYGGVDQVRVRVGQHVRVGQVVATAGASRLYFGLRDEGRYIDPEPLLGVRRFPVRLVPADGSGRASGGPGRLVCPLARGSR